jgi:holin-like protein
MQGLAILLAFQLAGWALHEWVHVPLPANVLGFFLLTGALLAGWVKLSWVEDAARWLLNHMSLFFVPLVVSTMTFFPLLVQQALPIVASLVISTAIVLWTTAWLTQFLNQKRKGDAQRGTLE